MIWGVARRARGPPNTATKPSYAYRNALQVYTREQLPQEWAMTQNNLGVALIDLGRRVEGRRAAEMLNQAVEAYRNALQVYTRDALPKDWAATQGNSGPRPR